MRRAVVLGSGVAGLACAAVLATLVDEVLVVERDELPADAAPRRGVPQGDQLHNLLGRGQVELERIFPGLLGELRAHGCQSASVGDETHVHEMGGVMPRRPLDLRLMAVERPLVEHLARRALLASAPGIRCLEATTVTDLLSDGAGAVAGVVTVDRAGRAERLGADVVVDATGAGTRAPAWLARLGVEVPPATTATPDQWYASVRLSAPPPPPGEPSFVLVFPTPPGSRGGLLSPLGRDGWHLSVNGRSRDPVPDTFDGIRAHVASLEDRVLARRLEDAVALGPVTRFRRTTATWRRYDLVEAPLAGFLPVGDAVASLNPLFGQGLSVAAWQAGELRPALEPWAEGRGRLAAGTAELHRRAAAIVGQVWALGEVVAGDVIGDDPDHVTVRSARVLRALGDDPDLHRCYVEVWHLLRPASSLTAPLSAHQAT